MAKKQNQGVNLLLAGVGVVAGILAGAAAMFLSDEKNRKKAKGVLEDMEREGEKTLRKAGKKLSTVGKKKA